MPRLLTALSAAGAKEGHLRRLPSVLCLLLILVGAGWLLMLPLDEYSRRTYISENALLPDQVHTYFAGSEHNVFRAFRHEVADLEHKSQNERSAKLVELFTSMGLKSSSQNYTYNIPDTPPISGQNVYAVLDGPRADRTESLVLLAPWKNADGEMNYSGVALVLSLARYFTRWSMWSKNIIFVIPADSVAGPQAWVDAYHDLHQEPSVEPLRYKAGAIQAAVALDYTAGPWGRRFGTYHIVYDGINGQLPNLDLINTAAVIASRHSSRNVAIQNMLGGHSTYSEKLQTMARGMLKQGLGVSSGPHSPFIPYHIDAITLQAVGDGWEDEISLGRTVESLFRSLNNLMEHLHQSFFFFILANTERFVSIGTYLPSAMLVAASFTVRAIDLWIRARSEGASKAASKTPMLPILGAVVATYGAGLVPALLFGHLSPKATSWLIRAGSTLLFALSPSVTAYLANLDRSAITKPIMLYQSFILLTHGALLSTLATLNFSLAFFLGIITSPLCFFAFPFSNENVSPTTAATARTPKSLLSRCVPILLTLTWLVISPLSVLIFVSRFWKKEILTLASATSMSSSSFSHSIADDSFVQLLAMAIRAGKVNGLWTPIVAWLVWWPAWFAGLVVIAPFVNVKTNANSKPAASQPSVKTVGNGRVREPNISISITGL